MESYQVLCVLLLYFVYIPPFLSPHRENRINPFWPTSITSKQNNTNDFFIWMIYNYFIILSFHGTASRNNIVYDLYVSFVDAALGGSMEVPTIDGKVRIKIDPGTQSGKILRLRGKGIKDISYSNQSSFQRDFLSL